MTSVAKRLGRVIPLPNLRLTLRPPDAKRAIEGVDEVTFITTPDATKTEIKSFLERVLGVAVADVRTANRVGKKRRDRGGLHHRPDTKLAYVRLSERWFPPPAFRAKSPADDASAADASNPSSASRV